MRRTLIVQALDCGGAERVLSWLANCWRAKGDDVTILTLDRGVVTPFFPLEAGIQRSWIDATAHSRGTLQAIARNVGRIIRLRRAIRRSRPEVVISFVDTTNVLVLLATVGLRLPVIVSERCDPRLVPLPRAWRNLRGLTYRWATAVVVQTARTAEWFSEAVRRRSEIIPNPVSDMSAAIAMSTHRRDRRRRIVLGVGRLEHQKGFDLLLRAFGSVARERPAWQLQITGEGPLRESLDRLATELGLADRVTFTGTVRDIATVYSSADVFVMPSRFEGFPNALAEAMAAGLPVIAADCLTGPREIVTPGVDGLLVPTEDVQALAVAMAMLMDDEHRRQDMGVRAQQISSRLSQETTIAKWDNLIARVTGRWQQ